MPAAPLLGEHRELHAVWSVITQGKRGYSNHPETNRWRGRLAALYGRHEELVCEMKSRGYRQNSPLEGKLATGSKGQEALVDPLQHQEDILRSKGCGCFEDA